MTTNENKNPDLETLVLEIKNHLNVVNAALIQPEDFSAASYDDIVELHEYVKKKQGKLTLMEIEGVLDELRSLRQSK
ncbi:DUF1128 family protein [Shimazuella kribbensis]|uniref:DUF1128 family protein n=1 Tax=Shimazuella kribbensis TaxID=139808 RepID=UPI000410662F|nr:DUF1128 family protein [Shimazuella kribbensis]